MYDYDQGFFELIKDVIATPGWFLSGESLVHQVPLEEKDSKLLKCGFQWNYYIMPKWFLEKYYT